MSTRSAPSVLTLILISLAAITDSPAGITLSRFDKNHSTVGFVVPILGGFSEVEGKFTEFDVTIEYDEDYPSRSSVTAVIQAGSIDTGIEDRDKHLRSADFFDVESHPEITFKSRSIEGRDGGMVAHGTLTMRGVSKGIALPFEIKGIRKNEEKNTILIGLSAHFKLNRRDDGVAWTHPDVPDFVSEEVEIDIRLISKLNHLTPEDPTQ